MQTGDAARLLDDHPAKQCARIGGMPVLTVCSAEELLEGAAVRPGARHRAGRPAGPRCWWATRPARSTSCTAACAPAKNCSKNCWPMATPRCRPRCRSCRIATLVQGESRVDALLQLARADPATLTAQAVHDALALAVPEFRSGGLDA